MVLMIPSRVIDVSIKPGAMHAVIWRGVEEAVRVTDAGTRAEKFSGPERSGGPRAEKFSDPAGAGAQRRSGVGDEGGSAAASEVAGCDERTLLFVTGRSAAELRSGTPAGLAGARPPAGPRFGCGRRG